MPNGFLRPYVSRISFLQRLLDGLLIFSVYWGAFTLHDGDWDAKRILAAVLAVLLFMVFAKYAAYTIPGGPAR